MKRMIIELPERLYQEIIDGGVEKVSPELYWVLYNCDPVPEGHMKWIPCSEIGCELPEEQEKVLLTHELVYTKEKRREVIKAFWDGQIWNTNELDLEYIPAPVAWMRIPKPYEEKEDVCNTERKDR